MGVEPNKGRVLSELRRCLRVLARPGTEALASLPDGCAKADELALEYGDAVIGARAFSTALAPAQWSALTQIDALLAGMSGEENAELWSEAAVVAHPRWQEVRRAAVSAMALIGWSADVGTSNG